MFVKIEPSGCVERKGLVQIRFAMYLEPSDYGYDVHHVQVYERKLTQEEMDNPALADLVPKVWRNNPFHNHFIYVEPDITDKEIIDQMKFHLPNFYAAWKADKPIRAGWDTKTRKQPKRYGLDALRKARVLARVEGIKSTLIQIKVDKRGETFPATAIDVGAEAIDRDGYETLTGKTYLGLDNPANDTGWIDTVEWFIYDAGADSTAVIVGTFYFVSGDDYKCRDSEAVGTIARGSKQTSSGLSIDVTTGDFIGCYAGFGYIERHNSGYAGIYWVTGQYIDPNDQATYTSKASHAISVKGLGDTVPSYQPGTRSANMAAKMMARGLI